MKKLIALYKKLTFENKTIYFGSLSCIICLLFALYNGLIGLLYPTPWNISIGVYYLLLCLLRAFALNREYRILKKKASINSRKRTVTFISCVMLLMNLALIPPIILLVLNQRDADIGLIPGIVFALYTTIKVTNSAVNLKRKTKSDNIMVKTLRNINFIDALVSVLTLQNTLIAVNGHTSNSNMTYFTVYSSFGILAFILIITLLEFRLIKSPAIDTSHKS